MKPNHLGLLQLVTCAVITTIWICGGLFFASIFVSDYPQYAAQGYGSAVLCGLTLGLLHLGWLALFRSPAACWGLIIAKVCALPVTFFAGFFSLAMGAMGTDSGMENAARASGGLVAFCMAIAAFPTTLAALLGAVIGFVVGKQRDKQVEQASVTSPLLP